MTPGGAGGSREAPEALQKRVWVVEEGGRWEGLWPSEG